MTAVTDFERFEAEPLQSYRPVFLTSLAAILCLFGAAIGWGMFARLDAAVVTQGVVLAESQRKSVEHLEGGILQQLWVRAGDRVREGQIVATLDATQTAEALAQFQADLTALTFESWRLEAELEGAGELMPATLPDAARSVSPEERTNRTRAQIRLFDARLRAHVGQIDALQRQIGQLQATATANDAQAASADRQMALWHEERAFAAQLVEKGATPRQKLLELDRTIAALEGNRDEFIGLADAARQDISRARAEIETLKSQRIADIGTRLAEAEREMESLESRIRAGRDVLERHKLRAPQTGRVVEIFTITPGAVVASGAPIMEIVPDEDKLIVETKLAPEAIDTVHAGRAATVRLIAYKRAQAPLVDGEVTYVSPDLLTDPMDGSTYFEARVTIDPDEIDELEGAELVAGMPVEVSILTGERRAGEYLLEPLLRHLNRAFREE
ncbi:HlyD family type I secretion periplasmic adaptor subunit [Amaricoccus macauensis]|uniref:HlyD family type I secretion periplasmic adaptor subunit n=1 Tax=Amaricoccus macauensis TaxID=57001 RepID=UPI003C7C5EBD